MENLLESNERTLVIFEAVCSGLAECLELVHADIRQMSEHRNQLQAEREQRQQQLKGGAYAETNLNDSAAREENSQEARAMRNAETKTTDLDSTLTSGDGEGSPGKTPQAAKQNQQDDDDPHHLARLKLLDKRLADSFSQALSMCDRQKSSLLARHEQQQQLGDKNSSSSQRPSIFQVLLGKGGGGNRLQRKKGTAAAAAAAEATAAQLQTSQSANNKAPDSKMIIDDINKQTRLAMQYSKQLEANLVRVEELRARYEMHLKMGLVVKSVSRAYLTSGTGAPDKAHHSHHSLGRPRRAHHLSSLMVNGGSGGGGGHDTSSLGTSCTRSSLSSLNLSTWSFSRRHHSATAAAAAAAGDQQRKRSLAMASPSPVLPHDTVDHHHNQQQQQQQKYVSTVSLDSMSRRRSGLARLISPTGGHKGKSHKQQQPAQQRSEFEAGPQSPASCYLDQQHHLLYRRGGGGDERELEFDQQPDLDQCQCGLLVTAGIEGAHSPPGYLSPAPISQPDSSFQATPHLAQGTRPLSQYMYGAAGEPFATPTTTGTLAPAALLHKSASHSSLKKSSTSKTAAAQQQQQQQLQQLQLQQIHNHRSGSLYPNAPQMQMSSRTTIKEFIDNIERIEADFEAYMGSFLMNIEDIQGFARVCQGDVFEINIRYGSAQKFKSKISVLKDSRQKCDHRQTVFKARIADVIAIKAYECKGLGKKVLLGHKLCETRDLFMARSQLMTISLNQTGSIKLNLVITWNPLHMTPNSSLGSQPGLDLAHISLPPTPISSSTLSSVSSAQSSTNSASGGKSSTNLNNNNNNHHHLNRTIISIKSDSSGGRRDQQLASPPTHQQPDCDRVEAHHHHHHHHHQQKQQQPDEMVQYHYPVSEHQLKRAEKHQKSPAAAQVASPVYQPDHADPAAYGYYIPEPDYLSSGELKY